MKHFEELWEEAEHMAENKSEAEIIKFISDNLNNLQEPLMFGEIIFNLCNLSKKYNINVYAALYHFINEKKVDTLE